MRTPFLPFGRTHISSKDATHSFINENPGIYCNIGLVSQPITWLIFCFGWKRWVLCTRKPWNDEHLSGAVGNFLGSSSCAPFGVQPHQNQLPVCAYVWGEIKRQCMLRGHICSSPYTLCSLKSSGVWSFIDSYNLDAKATLLNAPEWHVRTFVM